MADILDVLNAIAGIAANALYPNGASQPSSVGAACKIYPGWPIGQTLDADLAEGDIVHVSAFPMRGSSSNVPQPLSKPVELPGAHGVAASISGNTITLTGTPAPGEFVTLILDGAKAYSRGGDSVAAIAAALLADLFADYPGSSVSGGALTIPAARAIVMRGGAPGKVVSSVRRMAVQVMVTIWAPSPQLRSSVGSAVATALINNYRFDLADASQVRLTFSRMDDWDNRENANLYRRDLVFTAEYAITETVDGVEVTAFDGMLSIDDYPHHLTE